MAFGKAFETRKEAIAHAAATKAIRMAGAE